MTELDQIVGELDSESRKYQRWSSGDVIRLVVGLIVLTFGLFLAAIAKNTIGGAEEDVISWFNRLPDRTIGVVIGTGQFIIVAVPLAVWGLLIWRRNFRLLAMQWLAANVASWTMTLIESRYSDRLGVVEDTHSLNRGWLAGTAFPTSSVIAGSAAFVVVTAPWLSRRWRRTTWVMLSILVLLRIVGSGEPPLDIVVAVSMGVVAGSLALLVFGSPSPFPRASELVAALRGAGLNPTALNRAGDGLTPYFAVDVSAPDRSLLVKVLTPEDRSSDLLNRLWGSLRLRSSEVERPFSSLKRRVEHEAFATTVARNAGAAVPEVVSLGETEHGSVFIAYSSIDAVSIADIDPARITPAVLQNLWSQLAVLRSVRVAHRNITLGNVLLDSVDDVYIADFDRSEISAPDRDLARDIAELLVSLSSLIGPAATVSAAVNVLGSDVVAECLPQLQPLALSPEVRGLAKAHKGLLDEVSSAVRETTGAPAVELEKLERIRIKTVLIIVAGSLAFYSLLPQLANIDQTTSALSNANLWWLPAILVGSASTYVFATISALGAYSLKLPAMATLRSQLASSFTALVAPANAGGMALGVRFLQKAGFDTAAASSAVGLNAIGGIVMHVALLIAFVSWTGQTGVGDFSIPSTSTALVVVAAVLALSAGLLLIAPIRHRVMGPIIRIVKSAGGHLGSVFKSPTRVLALFGGSMMVTLAYAATLVFAVEAFGGGLSVPAICTAFMVGVTISTIAPTPGGIGAFEAAMIASLAGFGLDHGPAVASVLVFRLATFWLPILPGWYTFVWMERNGEL